MIFTTVGLWINYSFDFHTVACIFVAIGCPLLLNIVTKVSASWFGPKGRNVATTVLLLAYFIPNTVESFIGRNLIDASLVLSIVSSIIMPLCFMLIYDKPDFSPTMSQEERLNTPTLSFKTQIN
jgi:ABC-type sugar transport system permease subunit